MAKRLADVTLSTVALLVLLPLLLLVAITVVVTLGRPVLFRQQRAGLDGEPFVLYKFRTMRQPLSPGSELADDEERVTRVGRALRATSIDES